MKFAAKWKGLRRFSEWTLPPPLDHYDALGRATFALGVAVAVFFIVLMATRIYSMIWYGEESMVILPWPDFRSLLTGNCGLMNMIVGSVLEVGLAASRCVPLRGMGIPLHHFRPDSWLAAVSVYEWVNQE